jgi:SAM-dependent methyltransferase
METVWDKKRSEWYSRAVDGSNYPANAVKALRELLKECESVLDIGAGCGALSIPIAKKVKRVTAVEPSKCMFEILKNKVKKAGLRNIRAYNAGWRGARFQGDLQRKLRPHDMVICANLPYRMVCNERFLRHITEKARHYIVYLQGAGGWNRFYYRDLYPLLLKRKYRTEGDYMKTYMFLHKQGILPNVKIVDFYLDQPFDDFKDALDFWHHRLNGILSPKKESMLENFLRKKLIPSGKKKNALVAPFGLRRAALTWWRP